MIDKLKRISAIAGWVAALIMAIYLYVSENPFPKDEPAPVPVPSESVQ